jgi:hypothetical protein
VVAEAADIQEQVVKLYLIRAAVHQFRYEAGRWCSSFVEDLAGLERNLRTYALSFTPQPGRGPWSVLGRLPQFDQMVELTQGPLP